MPPNKAFSTAEGSPRSAERNKMELTKRLSKIASYINVGSVVADIGTDHAAIPIWLLSNGICSHAILTDIHKGPLDSAKENMKRAALSSFAEFYLTDGISEILSLRPDWYVIAGMGGETIAGILSVENTRFLTSSRFILQPMTKQEKLRETMSELGYVIDSEELVREDDRIYTVMTAHYTGEKQTYSPLELICGKPQLEKSDPDTLFYLEKILDNLKKQYFGKRLSRTDTPEDLALIKELEGHISSLKNGDWFER